LTRSTWVIIHFIYFFEPLSSQSAQLFSKFNRCGIRFGTGPLVPLAQPRAQSRREEVLHRLVDSCGVRPFEHLKQIVCADQGTDLAQVPGNLTRVEQVAVIALLQLCIFKVHDAPSSDGLAKMAGTGGGNSDAAGRAGALLVQPRLAYDEIVRSDLFSMKSPNGGSSTFRRGHGDEPETAGAAIDAINRDVDLHNIAIR